MYSGSGSVTVTLLQIECTICTVHMYTQSVTFPPMPLPVANLIHCTTLSYNVHVQWFVLLLVNSHYSQFILIIKTLYKFVQFVPVRQ